MRPAHLFIAAAFAAATVALWALANGTRLEPAWPTRVAGLSFSPMRAGDDPTTGRYPSLAEIEQDIRMLSGRVRSLRTYSVDDTLAAIPAIAGDYGMTVTLGVWLGKDLALNEEQLAKAIDIARANPSVTRVIVGNEAVWRKELTPAELAGYLARARGALAVPVSTAEPWHVWLKHPELARHTDFVAAHVLPYWEGIGLEAAIRYVEERHDELRRAFPERHVLLAEVGWPSEGRTRRDAVASPANEATFLRRFLRFAEWQGYDYYVIEAFDQPWKMDEEGAVGGYWGIYDVDRNAKFAFTGPVERIPQWPVLASASVALAAVALVLMLLDGGNLRHRALSFLAITANVVAAGLVWVTNDIAQQYLTPTTAAVLLLLLLGFVFVTVVLLTEAHELAEASWVTGRRRAFGAAAVPPLVRPKVSIHVPAYNEPPQMVIETLDALARLDYEDFEVILVDNNTEDPAVWRPVAEHCAALGPRFRFFHVRPLAGFKAGALNLALRQTAPAAEIVAVIDSDYVVRPDWLKALVPHFDRPEVGIVQAPQDYRDGGASLFKGMCVAEYAGFFQIGMVTRNDRNAIIEHGTMTLIRRAALEAAGGWAEWCITEDAELGLRILERGYEAVYVPESYGRGLSPDTFLDYKKQRFRWAYGAVQILKRHSREILGRRHSRLTAGQRYHFVAGWLPWLADGVNLLFTLGALVWAAVLAMDPAHVDPPPLAFTLPPVALFLFKVIKTGYLYGARLRAAPKAVLGAAIAGLALSHVVARAVLKGLVTTDLPFFRTPKCEDRPALVQALASVREEAALMLALWVAAATVALLVGRESPDALLWAILMVVQSIPYGAAVLMALASALAGRRLAGPAAGRPAVLPVELAKAA